MLQWSDTVESTESRHGNTGLFAVFGHRAPRYVVALSLQSRCQSFIAQRRALVFLVDKVSQGGP